MPHSMNYAPDATPCLNLTVGPR
jgi:hypothetical protein